MEHIIKGIRRLFYKSGLHYPLLGCKSRGRAIQIKKNMKTFVDLSTEIGEGELLSFSLEFSRTKRGYIPTVSVTDIYPKNLQIKDKKIFIYGLPTNGPDGSHFITYVYAPKKSKKIYLTCFY
jgi:hypothetical protein